LDRKGWRAYRKRLGMVVMIVSCACALVATALAQGRITEASKPVQTIAYIVLGLVWVLPLIKWMERKDGL